MLEYQLENEIQHEFNRHGARFPSYNTIVISGENGCIFHYTENVSKMKNSDLVLIEASCEYQGCVVNITRSFPVNRHFSPEQRAICDLVFRMLNSTLELYAPGCSIQEVGNYGGSSERSWALEPGMVLTIEPVSILPVTPMCPPPTAVSAFVLKTIL